MRHLEGHAQSQKAEHMKLQGAFWIGVFVSRDQHSLGSLTLLHGTFQKAQPSPVRKPRYNMGVLLAK